MQQPFVKGDLVQLLGMSGEVHEDTLGTVLGLKRGKLMVHWHIGAENYPNAAYEWGRIIHANAAV